MEQNTSEELAALTHDHALTYLIGLPSIAAVVLLGFTALAYYITSRRGLLVTGAILTVFGILGSFAYITHYNTTNFYQPLAARVSQDIVDHYHVESASFEATPSSAKALLGHSDKSAAVHVVLGGGEEHMYAITLDEHGNAALEEPITPSSYPVTVLRKNASSI